MWLHLTILFSSLFIWVEPTQSLEQCSLKASRQQIKLCAKISRQILSMKKNEINGIKKNKESWKTLDIKCYEPEYYYTKQSKPYKNLDTYWKTISILEEI